MIHWLSVDTFVLVVKPQLGKYGADKIAYKNETTVYRSFIVFLGKLIV